MVEDVERVLLAYLSSEYCELFFQYMITTKYRGRNIGGSLSGAACQANYLQRKVQSASWGPNPHHPNLA